MYPKLCHHLYKFDVSGEPYSLLITDSIAKYVKLANGKLYVIPLPGKDIQYVCDKMQDRDEYNTAKYSVIIVHLGAVNVLNILQGHSDESPVDLIHLYRDVYNCIRDFNKSATIIFSGVIPIPEYRRSPPLVKEVNNKLEMLASSRQNAFFIDSAARFTNNRSILRHCYAIDKVHLRFEAVKVLNNWFGQVITPAFITEKLESRRKKFMGRLHWWV